MKAVEVKCATVSELPTSTAEKCKRAAADDGDDDESHSGATPEKRSKSKDAGRPNKGKQANDRNLWEALKAGINFERSPHQIKKLDNSNAGNITMVGIYSCSNYLLKIHYGHYEY